jgi:hypothetical protein
MGYVFVEEGGGAAIRRPGADATAARRLHREDVDADGDELALLPALYSYRENPAALAIHKPDFLKLLLKKIAP